MPDRRENGDKPSLPEADDTPKPLTDRRAMERLHAAVGRLLGQHEPQSIDEANAMLRESMQGGKLVGAPPPVTALEKAQELMYDAFEAAGRRRIALAKQALAISADCADAYVLLAEEDAETDQAALRLYEQAVAAGERALGKELFEREAGHFWGILETRPYMRARAGLALTLWELDRRAEAIAHAQDMLRLNPGDNQGMRYNLLAWLLTEKRDQAASALMDEYDEDNASFAYSRAILSFRREGDTPAGQKLMQKAFAANHFVPLLLIGVMAPPADEPEYYSDGDLSEAVMYLDANHGAWENTPGFVEWFADVLRHSEGVMKQTMKRWVERQAALLRSQGLPDVDMLMRRTQETWRHDQESKTIPLAGKLEKLLNGSPAVWVDGIADSLSVPVEGKKKGKIAGICRLLLNMGALHKVVADLPERSRQALRDVLRKGGWQPYAPLSRKYGSEKKDGYWWLDEPPTSILGRLRLAGLLYVGMTVVDGRSTKVAVIPIDLRPLLHTILKLPDDASS